MDNVDFAELSSIKEDLRKLWIEQLYREYDYICREYRVRLTRPVIRIQTLLSRWATWDPLTRTITINAELIENHPWDAVLEILKHEMAHQLVWEARGNGYPHGPDFSGACRVLRVADWAALASGEIGDVKLPWKGRVLGAEEERLLRRVEKLLSLANSSNEHEALLAMQRVQEIYARHNIERLKARREAGIVTVTVHFRKKRVDRLTSTICSILGEHFFVRVIYCRTYDAKDVCEYQSVELIGTRANVLMAEYVYHFLRDRLSLLWDQYRERSGVEGRAKQDYMLGLLAGFRKKLAEGREQVVRSAACEIESSQTRALMALGDRELETFVRHRYPRLGRRRWSMGYTDLASYTAGVEEGGRIVLNKPLGESGGRSGQLLPGGSCGRPGDGPQSSNQ